MSDICGSAVSEEAQGLSFASLKDQKWRGSFIQTFSKLPAGFTFEYFDEMKGITRNKEKIERNLYFGFCLPRGQFSNCSSVREGLDLRLLIWAAFAYGWVSMKKEIQKKFKGETIHKGKPSSSSMDVMCRYIRTDAGVKRNEALHFEASGQDVFNEP